MAVEAEVKATAKEGRAEEAQVAAATVVVPAARRAVAWVVDVLAEAA